MRKNGTPQVPTFVKWAGGKSQLLEQFDKFYPKEIDYYVEPFLGSGAVFFHIKRKYNPKKVLLADINEELINTFIVVRDRVEELIELLRQHKEKHNKDNKEYYYNIRSIDTEQLNDVEKAARFIYLNKTCFNGLYRVNSKGKFNVPIGSYKTPSILQEEILREASKLLQGADIRVLDFRDFTKIDIDKAFVYFDPPYYPLSKTSSFTSYTKGNFLEEEQEELAGVYKKLHIKGCKLMLSNSKHTFIESLYKGFKIECVLARRMINCDATKRGAITEYVITNYEVLK